MREEQEVLHQKKGNYKENIQAPEAEVAEKEGELVDIVSKDMNFVRESIETRGKVDTLARDIKAAEDLPETLLSLEDSNEAD